MAKEFKQTQGINIELGKGFIPVKIGGMDFKLSTSDSVYRKHRNLLSSLEKNYNQTMKKADELAENGDVEAELQVFEEAKDICRKATDGILGEGSFERLFEAAGGDTEAVMEAVFEVAQEFKNIKQKSKLSKLVEAKKK